MQKKDLLRKVMKRKLELFGHIARIDNKGMIKIVVMGTMDGNNRNGWPHRDWLDNIQEWCQKDIHQNSPRSKQMKTGGEMFVGHLRTF